MDIVIQNLTSHISYREPQQEQLCRDRAFQFNELAAANCKAVLGMLFIPTTADAAIYCAIIRDYTVSSRKANQVRSSDSDRIQMSGC